MYILSNGSGDQNLRQIYRLLDDRQVRLTSSARAPPTSTCTTLGHQEGRLTMVELQVVVKDLLGLLDSSYSPSIEVASWPPPCRSWWWRRPS